MICIPHEGPIGDGRRKLKVGGWVVVWRGVGVVGGVVWVVGALVYWDIQTNILVRIKVFSCLPIERGNKIR